MSRALRWWAAGRWPLPLFVAVVAALPAQRRVGPPEPRRGGPFADPRVTAARAVEVAWACVEPAQGPPAGDALRAALAKWRATEGPEARAVVVHLLAALRGTAVVVPAAELVFPGDDLARLAAAPLLVRSGEPGALFREFGAAAPDSPAWEFYGDALARLDHPAFAAELFLAWRPVLQVVATEDPRYRAPPPPAPELVVDDAIAIDLDGWPPLPRFSWQRGGEVVQLSRSYGQGPRRTLVLTAADRERARVRWLGALHREAFPAAFAAGFTFAIHQRDHPQFAARVAERRAELERDLAQIAAGLARRKLLPAARALAPKLAVTVTDERDEATRRHHPLPKVE